MFEAAVRTTASPAAIWTICVVVVTCLAFWLGSVAFAASRPIVRRRGAPYMTGPVLGGIHLAEGGRSVAPNRDAPALLASAGPAAPEQPGYAGSVPAAGTVVATGTVPAARAPAAGAAEAARPRVPGQRGDADRPERSQAGAGAPDSGTAGGG